MPAFNFGNSHCTVNELQLWASLLTAVVNAKAIHFIMASRHANEHIHKNVKKKLSYFLDTRLTALYESGCIIVGERTAVGKSKVLIKREHFSQEM